MDYECVSKKLKSIIKDRLEIDFNGEEMLKEKLLGQKVNLRARDLVYLLIDIEEKFDIVIPENEIADGKFDTFNNICSIIAEQLASKSDEVIVSTENL